MKRFITEQKLFMPSLDVLTKMTMIQDKVTRLLNIRRSLVSFKSDLRALLTMFNIKTADNSDLDNFLMNRDVLIGAIGEQLSKYADCYKKFEAVEGDAHLICLGPTSLDSNPNYRVIDIMGDVSDPIQWGRSLFYPFHCKWEEAKIMLKEKAENNRLKSQLPNADALVYVESMDNNTETGGEVSMHASISSDIYNRNNFPKCAN